MWCGVYITVHTALAAIEGLANHENKAIACSLLKPVTVEPGHSLEHLKPFAQKIPSDCRLDQYGSGQLRPSPRFSKSANRLVVKAVVQRCLLFD